MYICAQMCESMHGEYSSHLPTSILLPSPFFLFCFFPIISSTLLWCSSQFSLTLIAFYFTFKLSLKLAAQPYTFFLYTRFLIFFILIYIFQPLLSVSLTFGFDCKLSLAKSFSV